MKFKLEQVQVDENRSLLENMTSSEAPKVSRWLSAHYDQSAGLHTFSQCIAMTDLHGDGDHKLVIADLGDGVSVNRKLKIYKGTALFNESVLIDTPTALVTFYMDTLEPRIPAVGVASGSHVYIYKNLRPYFKFTLPSLTMHATEIDVWNQVKEDKVDLMTLREVLEGVRNEIGEANLTCRSKTFLTLDPEEMLAFAQTYKGSPLNKQTVITCLGTLKKSMSDECAIGCLVLGTESRNIHVLDPQAFTIVSTASLPSVPVFLSVLGLFDVDYQITTSCRDGKIYIFKRGMKDLLPSIELTHHPVAIETIAKNILVGCSDMTLRCYTNKGKSLWTLKLRAVITSTAIVDLRQLGTTLIAVATGDSKVQFFSDKYKVDEFITEDIVMAMRFGCFGREENTLTMVTSCGGLGVRILKRTARFETSSSNLTIPDVSNVGQTNKLNIPKKTKLFIDQTMRERENSTAMHRIYQQDLYKLRLKTARSYVTALESSLDPISTDPNEPIKLALKVQGLGPVFSMKVEVQNMSENKVSSDLLVAFISDVDVYWIEKRLVPVPMLCPGMQYVFQTMIKCIMEVHSTTAKVVKVLIFKKDKLDPLVTASVTMPSSEAASTTTDS